MKYGCIILLAAAVLFLAGCPSQPSGNSSSSSGMQAPASVTLEAQNKIENGDIDGATAYCEEELVKYPSDSTLNFIYSFSQFSSIVGDPKLRSFLSSFGISGMPGSFNDLKNALMNGSLNILLNGVPIASSNPLSLRQTLYMTNVSGFQKLIDDVLLSRINKSIYSLSIVKANNAFNLKLDLGKIYSNMINPSAQSSIRELDKTEVCAYYSYLSLIAAMINITLAEDLDCDWAKLEKMLTNSLANSANYYNPFNNPNFPNFGNLHSDGASRYSTAKAQLMNAINAADEGWNFLKSDTNNQSDHLIPNTFITPTLDNQITAGIQDMENSLNGQYSTLINTYIVNYSGISIGKFLDKAPSLRDLYFEINGSGEPRLYSTSTGLEILSPVNGTEYQLKWKDSTVASLFQSPVLQPFISLTNPRCRTL